MAALRGPLELDDGQVLPAVEVVDGQLKAYAWVATSLRLGSGTAGVTWPSLPRLPPWALAGGPDASVGFIRRSAAQGCVRPMLVEPGDPLIGVSAERTLPQRHGDPPEALFFESADEPFDDRDAAALADGAETRLDPASLAPSLEPFAPELRALVADDVPGRSPGLANGLGKEGDDLLTVGLLAEDGDAHGLPGEVVHNDGQPPAEGPALRQGKGQPGHPEAAKRNGRQVHVPDVVGALGGDDSLGRCGILCCCSGVQLAGRRLLVLGLEHPADGGGAEVQTRAGENLSELDFAEGRAGDLEAGSRLCGDATCQG